MIHSDSMTGRGLLSVIEGMEKQFGMSDNDRVNKRYGMMKTQEILIEDMKRPSDNKVDRIYETGGLGRTFARESRPMIGLYKTPNKPYKLIAEPVAIELTIAWPSSSMRHESPSTDRLSRVSVDSRETVFGRCRQCRLSVDISEDFDEHLNSNDVKQLNDGNEISIEDSKKSISVVGMAKTLEVVRVPDFKIKGGNKNQKKNLIWKNQTKATQEVEILTQHIIEPQQSDLLFESNYFPKPLKIPQSILRHQPLRPQLKLRQTLPLKKTMLSKVINQRSEGTISTSVWQDKPTFSLPHRRPSDRSDHTTPMTPHTQTADRHDIGIDARPDRSTTADHSLMADDRPRHVTRHAGRQSASMTDGHARVDDGSDSRSLAMVEHSVRFVNDVPNVAMQGDSVAGMADDSYAVRNENCVDDTDDIQQDINTVSQQRFTNKDSENKKKTKNGLSKKIDK